MNKVVNASFFVIMNFRTCIGRHLSGERHAAMRDAVVAAIVVIVPTVVQATARMVDAYVSSFGCSLARFSNR